MGVALMRVQLAWGTRAHPYVQTVVSILSFFWLVLRVCYRLLLIRVAALRGRALLAGGRRQRVANRTGSGESVDTDAEAKPVRHYRS